MLLPSRSTLLIHQAKLISSLWKQRSRKSRSALPRADAVHVVDAPDGPGVDRRVQVGELPLVGRDLAVGVLELLEQQDPELVLGELGVDQGEADALERQVPGREPGILPLVGHRHHPQRVEVPPVLIADVLARRAAAGCADCRRRARRGRRRCSSAWSRAGRRAPGAGCAARRRWPCGGWIVAVELVGLAPSLGDDVVDLGRAEAARSAAVGEPQPKHDRAAGRDGVEPVMERGLGAHLERVDALLAVDDEAVKRVLDVTACDVPPSRPKTRAHVRLVVGEEELAAGRAHPERPRPEPVVRPGSIASVSTPASSVTRLRPVRAFAARGGSSARVPRRRPPGPGVAEPESAAGCAAAPASGPRLNASIRMHEVLGRRPWRTRSRCRSSGPRRRCRCRAARTRAPGRLCAGSPRRAGDRDTRACGYL